MLIRRPVNRATTICRTVTEPDREAQPGRKFDQAIEVAPPYAQAFNNRGAAWQTKGDLDMAISDYSRAIEIDPSDPVVFFNRGLAQNVRGRWDDAIRSLDRSIDWNRSSAAAYLNRGNAWYAEQDWAGGTPERQ